MTGDDQTAEHTAEIAPVEHTPLDVWNVDGMPFVRCSCDRTSGSRPQSAVWLREHWQGTQDDGVAALQAVVAEQRRQAGQYDALADPGRWPACATYPALGCVCRSGLGQNKATCTRKRSGDLTPILSVGELAAKSAPKTAYDNTDCTCNPYFGDNEFSPDCPRHGAGGVR